MQLLGFKFGLRRVPYYDEIVRQLPALDAAHVKPKADIWGARNVSLEGRPGLAPIIVAIWDCGVDTAVFPGRVWTNAKEVPGNGKDDDGNGYVERRAWEVMRLSERIKFYNQHYAHGTHVAGIAVRGNPAARLLIVRMDDPTRQVAPPATVAWAAGFARAISRCRPTIRTSSC